VLESALSIPQSEDQLGQLIEKYWTDLRHLVEGGAAMVKVMRKMPTISWATEFSSYTDEKIAEGIKEFDGKGEVEVKYVDLKTPEWVLFSDPEQAPKSEDLELSLGTVPEKMEEWFTKVVLVKRMREVTSLLGFTRITSPRDLEPGDGTWSEVLGPLSRQSVPVVPAVESRGEGLFLVLNEDKVSAWCERADVIDRLEKPLREMYANRRAKLGLHPPEAGFKGIRYVLLHTLSHVLMRQFAISCGYSAASLRERIYAREANEEGGPMAGILIYTAAADSEGTLGGLVALGEQRQLEYHFFQALEQAGLCASDPLCAEHEATGQQMTMHGAACHACLFAPETSCEYNNRFLDRTVLVETMRQSGLGFFSRIVLTAVEDQVMACLSVAEKPLPRATIQKATGLTPKVLDETLHDLIKKELVAQEKTGNQINFKVIKAV
jgi:hypothetical protein